MYESAAGCYPSLGDKQYETQDSLMTSSEKKIFVDSFFNRDDAYHWMDQHLREHEDWLIEEASLVLINGYSGLWRAGITISKKKINPKS